MKDLLFPFSERGYHPPKDGYLRISVDGTGGKHDLGIRGAIGLSVTNDQGMLLHALCEYTGTGVSREHEMRAIVKGLKVGESFIPKLQKPITLVSDSIECIKIATGQPPDFDGSEDFNLLAKEAQLLYFKPSQANKVKLTMRHTIRDDNKLADALAGFALHTMETEGIEYQVFENFFPE